MSAGLKSRANGRPGTFRITPFPAFLIWLSLTNNCLSGELPMDSTKLLDFANRYTGAWCSQDASSVAGFFADDGVLYVNGEPSEGREAIAAVAQGFMTAFPDMVLLMDDLDVGAEQVIYHWTFIGTNSGPEGTGNAVRFSGHEEWTLGDDGLIERSMGHFDAEDYQRQLGATGARSPQD